jgi:hypothetical protein
MWSGGRAATTPTPPAAWARTGPAATLTTATIPEAAWAIQAVRATADGSRRQSCHSYVPENHPPYSPLRRSSRFRSPSRSGWRSLSPTSGIRPTHNALICRVGRAPADDSALTDV